MQKPKSLEQIANELAAKREPIKMEPKPKNTGGIDLSRAAGALNQQPKQNLAHKLPVSHKARKILKFQVKILRKKLEFKI